MGEDVRRWLRSGLTGNARGYAGGNNKYVQRGSAPFSERMGSNNAGTEAFADRQRKSTKRDGNARAVDGKEALGAVAPVLGSQKTPKAMRVVRRTSGRKRGKEGGTVR